MFKAESMTKTTIYVLSEELQKVTTHLYDLKLMQFFSVQHEQLERFSHGDVNELSRKLLKVRSSISILKNYLSDEKGLRDDPIDHPLDTIHEKEQSIGQLRKEISYLEDEIKRAKVSKALNIKEKELKEKSHIVGFIPAKQSNQLKRLKKSGITVRSHKLDERIYFVAKLPKKVEQLPINYTEFYLPQHSDDQAQKKLESKQKEQQELAKELSSIANTTLKSLRQEEAHLTREISAAEAVTHFAKTKHVAVLRGYIPSKCQKKLTRALDELLGERYEVEFDAADHDAPVKLNHPGSIHDFMSLLKMYSLPKYRELDPTFLLFLVFPLFYGFVLGDVVYGILSLLLFSVVKWKMPQFRAFMSILQVSSISSILWGIIYGEFIGYEFHGPLWGFIARSHEPQLLLIMAIGFGLLHINMGLIVGFLNHLHDLKHAIGHSLSWIIMEVGAALLGVGIYAGITAASVAGAIIGLLGVALIYYGHGFIGLVELPSFFSNILSYARLMAVGLSSIVIAMLINEYSTAFFNAGFLGAVAGIILFTAGHVFNIFLGNFESFLHTLRLHYVEFFTKFYEGGGEEFQPFGSRTDVSNQS